MHNVRDLGGLPVRDGHIKQGALIRAESLTRLGDGGVDRLAAEGVSRVVDLRRVGESSEPHPYADDGDIYVNLPVEDPGDLKTMAESMAELYVEMVDARPDLFAGAVAAIADAPAGAVVVHCAGGKDRTGLVVAMALTLAGADPDRVAADYALTQERNAPLVNGYLESIEDETARERVREFIATPESNMLTVLEHIDAEHGGVEAYLRSGGLSEDQARRLRQRLVTDET
jgi:protein tyrosine/serine phosphatase